MRKIIYGLIVMITFSGITFAQKELGFEFDYAKFNYDSTSVYVEFYYSLSTRDMRPTNTQNGPIVDAMVHIEMKTPESEQFFINKDWMIQSPVEMNVKDGSSNFLSGVMSFIVPNGKYSLKVSAYDKNNPSFSKSINENIVVDAYKVKKFSISDIEIATNIKTDNVDQNSLFYKNTLEVVPNASMIYTHQAPVMFYYAELYNLKLDDSDADFTLQRTLYNSSGTQLNTTTRKIKQGENSVVDYGVVNLSKYPTDSYNYVLSLVNPSTKQAYISSKRFYFYNPNVVDSVKSGRVNTDVLGSEYAVMNNEECDKLFSESKYIASSEEVSQYKKIDSLKAKREFLFKFWQKRDSDPATSKNEFKEEYMRRLAFANKNFSSTMKEGYLTDRGRVVMLYGEPDQRDFFPSDKDLKPYEVWFYSEIEGGVNFYFGDITGFGNYELLHSTKRGEVKDDNWLRRISTL